jgi:hypothetical protein
VTRTERQIEQHRKANALLQILDDAGRPCASVPVWVEQESHAFLFGCAVPDLEAVAPADQVRYRTRLAEVCNQVERAGLPLVGGSVHVEVPRRAHLGTLRLQLDQCAVSGAPLEVLVRGPSIGIPDLSERDSARRVAELYTLCFAHPAVGAIVWSGLWDGEQGVEGGLLRRDLSPRAAFRVLQKLIDVVWHTRASGVTDAEGLFRFRGFCGSYRVGVQLGETVEVALFSLERRPDEELALPIVLTSRLGSGTDSISTGTPC